MLTMNVIQKNLEEIRKRIALSAAKIDKTLEDVTLMAVTKTVDSMRIKEALACGIKDIGENRVQELVSKIDCFEGANIHLIGHLQKNKIKYIIGNVCLIHSVDSFELAEEINRQAGKINKTQHILLEVNASGEETKFGVTPNGAADTVKRILELPNLKLKGLMTMAPYFSDKEQTRDVFKRLKELSLALNLAQLSMGMSNDYEVAVEEGATIVRIGSGIFGHN